MFSYSLISHPFSLAIYLPRMAWLKANRNTDDKFGWACSKDTRSQTQTHRAIASYSQVLFFQRKMPVGVGSCSVLVALWSRSTPSPKSPLPVSSDRLSCRLAKIWFGTGERSLRQWLVKNRENSTIYNSAARWKNETSFSL